MTTTIGVDLVRHYYEQALNPGRFHELDELLSDAVRLQTAFFRMVAELNDLPEVTGAAEWRFREQLKPSAP